MTCTVCDDSGTICYTCDCHAGQEMPCPSPTCDVKMEDHDE